MTATFLVDDLLEKVTPDLTMDEDLTGETVEVRFCSLVSIQLAWTGTPTGSFFIQASNDGVDFISITAGDAAGGAAGETFIELADVSQRYVRLFYDFGSGTGTLTKAHICAK